MAVRAWRGACVENISEKSDGRGQHFEIGTRRAEIDTPCMLQTRAFTRKKRKKTARSCVKHTAIYIFAPGRVERAIAGLRGLLRPLLVISLSPLTLTRGAAGRCTSPLLTCQFRRAFLIVFELPHPRPQPPRRRRHSAGRTRPMGVMFSVHLLAQRCYLSQFSSACCT